MNARNTLLALLTCIITSVLPAASSAARQPEFEIKREHVEKLSAEMQREISSLQYLLNAYQLRQFFSLPDDDARRKWVDTYWRSRDPSPTTDKNEMRIEHTIRTKLARQLFPSKRWPGWDRRGEVFIRYGPPNYRGKIHAEITVRKTHPPGELWFYAHHQMIVAFRDQNLTGHYIYAINPFGAAQDASPELMEFLIYETDASLENAIPPDMLDFYRDAEIDPDADYDWTPIHEAIHGTEPKTYLRPRMRGVTERWDEIVDPDTPTWTPPPNPADVFFQDKAEKMANNFEITLEEVPSTYPFNFEDKTFPFYFDVGQFKGGEAVNRVEVNMELPIPEKADTALTLIASAVFMDDDFAPVAKEDREIVIPAGSGLGGRLLPAQLVFSLEEDYYRMAVTVEEAGSGRSSSYRSTVPFEDYGGALAVSNILFASKIERTERQSPFNRGALEVVPHPTRRYPVASSVPVYFEVYNLRPDDAGLSRYTVEYRIVPHTNAKRRFWDRFQNEPPVVASRFESSCYGGDDRVHVAVRTENLTAGSYDFLITVADERAGARAFRKATFRIVE